MDGEALRALQAPLKQLYRDDPSQARVVMTADAEIDFAQPQCAVATAGGKVVAGLHPAAGGDGLTACSGDMLLQALVACSGVTLSAVSIAMGIPIRAAQAHARAEMDFRGTLGIDRAAPIGLTGIELQFSIDSAAEDAQLSKLVELTERYCVVLQTLLGPTPLRSSWVRV